MIQIPVRYVVEDVDRHGNVRLYFRRKGCRKVRMHARRGTPEFFEEYQRLLAQSNAGKLKIAPRDAPKAETFRWLCDQYMRSQAFTKGLDASTQRVRRQIIDHMCAEPISPGSELTFRDCPLSRFGAKAVTVLRDRKHDAPESANARVKVIRVIYRWALDPSNEVQGVNGNPARDVPFVKPKRVGGFPPWTRSDIERFEKRHAIGSKPRLALALILATGARRSDTIVLGRQHVYKGPDGLRLKWTAHKGRNRSPVVIDIPFLQALQDIVATTPTGDLAYLVTDHSRRPFTHGYFGNWFRGQCRAAGVLKSAHGLRKVAAEWAAENGGTTQQLMAIFGWKDSKQAERYTRGADRKRMTADAPRLLSRPEPERECPTPDRECMAVGQLGAKK
jgi:integrase